MISMAKDMNTLNQFTSAQQGSTKHKALLNSTISNSVLPTSDTAPNSMLQNSLENASNFDLTNSFTNIFNQASNLFETESQENSVLERNSIEAISTTLSNKKTTLAQEDNSLESLQNGLLSSLGLLALSGQDDNAILSQLISPTDAQTNGSLANLQSSLLTSLQGNLFNAISAKNLTTTTAKEIGNVSLKQTDPLTNASSLIAAANAISSPSTLIEKVSEYSFGGNGLDITDGFDAVNVLQHIPILSSVYQETTGDTLNAAAKLSGGFIYGGTLGLALSAADLAIEYATGTSVSDKLTNFNYSELFFSQETNKANIATNNMASRFR